MNLLFLQLGNASKEKHTQLCCDYMGRMYEDIYHVIAQDERLDDWSSIIIKLKKHFIQFPKRLKKDGFPENSLAPASQGNFLEVLNLGANGALF